MLSLIPSTLLVMLGGAFGAGLRFSLGKSIADELGSGFPYATMLINILGSFLIGLLFAWSQTYPDHPQLKLFLATGVLGGFTTFSAFSLETLELLQNGAHVNAFVYVALSVLGSLGFVFLGYFLFNKL